MRFMRFLSPQGEARFGAVNGESIADYGPDDDGTALVAALQHPHESVASGADWNLAGVRPLPCIAKPPTVFGIGLNYEDHRLEVGAERPSEPLIFAKLASSVTGPDEPIVVPFAAPKRVDYEAELAVVIGRSARHVKAADALAYIGGYTVANDVTARDWQVKKPGGQWLLGKSFDTFLPIGSTVVTVEEVPDPQALGVTCVVSGEKLQAGNTAQMIFGVCELISYLSIVCTLSPGDVILTGTPGGVGSARNPRRWLTPGDVVETEVELVGRIVNPVVADGPQ